MLEVTEAAKERLHDSLKAADLQNEQGKCFRIMSQEDRSLTLNLTEPHPGDTRIEHDGQVVLAVPKTLESFFDDKCIDLDTGGRSLKITTH